MSDAIGFLFEQIGSFYNALSSVSFSIVGVTVTLTEVILGFICIGMIKEHAVNECFALSSMVYIQS